MGLLVLALLALGLFTCLEAVFFVIVAALSARIWQSVTTCCRVIAQNTLVSILLSNAQILASAV
jgi:type II secretory pathway component PulM